MNGILIAVPLCLVLLAAVAWWVWRRRGVAADSATAEVDAEMREVFLAEARAELVQLDRHLPLWRQAPTDLTRLPPLRRTFHTLKSAGRMVGAESLGALCDSTEKLLLRVMERELPPQAEVIDAVARAAAVLPDLVQAFATGTPAPRAAQAAVIATNERLLRGARSAGPRAAVLRD